MATGRRQNTRGIGGATAKVPQHVVHRSFAHETVILNLKTGRYHGLNPTAGTMLAELESGLTVREVAARVAKHFGRPVEEIERDLSDLCFDLLGRNLIELTGSNGRIVEAADFEGAD